MALATFSQSFFGALYLSLSETILNNSLRSLIARYSPAVNAENVIDAGTNGFRAVVDTTDLPGVLRAYAQSVDRVFYFTAAAGVICFLAAWGMGWRDIRTKPNVSKA